MAPAENLLISFLDTIIAETSRRTFSDGLVVMAQSGRSAAIFVGSLSSLAVVLGVAVGFKNLVKDPSITLDPRERRAPIRDNMAEARAYNEASIKRTFGGEGSFMKSVARRYTGGGRRAQRLLRIGHGQEKPSLACPCLLCKYNISFFKCVCTYYKYFRGVIGI